VTIITAITRRKGIISQSSSDTRPVCQCCRSPLSSCSEAQRLCSFSQGNDGQPSDATAPTSVVRLDNPSLCMLACILSCLPTASWGVCGCASRPLAWPSQIISGTLLFIVSCEPQPRFSRWPPSHHTTRAWVLLHRPCQTSIS